MYTTPYRRSQTHIDPYNDIVHCGKGETNEENPDKLFLKYIGKCIERKKSHLNDDLLEQP